MKRKQLQQKHLVETTTKFTHALTAPLLSVTRERRAASPELQSKASFFPAKNTRKWLEDASGARLENTKADFPLIRKEDPHSESLQSLICRPLTRKSVVPRAVLSRTTLLSKVGTWVTSEDVEKPMEYCSQEEESAIKIFPEPLHARSIRDKETGHWRLTMKEGRMDLKRSVVVGVSWSIHMRYWQTDVI